MRNIPQLKTQDIWTAIRWVLRKFGLYLHLRLITQPNKNSSNYKNLLYYFPNEKKNVHYHLM